MRKKSGKKPVKKKAPKRVAFWVLPELVDNVSNRFMSDRVREIKESYCVNVVALASRNRKDWVYYMDWEKSTETVLRFRAEHRVTGLSVPVRVHVWIVGSSFRIKPICYGPKFYKAHRLVDDIKEMLTSRIYLYM